MARHTLSAREVQTAQSGDCGDGDGLFLRVQPGKTGTTRASWVFRFTAPDGRRRELGLGKAERASIDAAGASLRRARKRADDARDLIDRGQDPIQAKHEHRASEKDKLAAKKKARQSEAMTLRRYARAYHESHVEPLRLYRAGRDWIAAIERHMPAELLDAPIVSIGASELLEALVPIVRKVPETGGKVYQRLSRIFDAAVIDGLRPDNPAAPIRRALRQRAGRRVYTSHAAMAYRQTPGFVADLQKQKGNAARCLEFLILTAARTSEALSAEWSEIDLQARTWTVPAEKMKAREPHVVQLCDRAVEILKAQEGQHARYVFPGPSGRLSNMALLTLLERMGLWGTKAEQRVTVHGFRATFSTWANELGIARPDVIEAALAHREADAVRRAYNRSDFARDRRLLMAAWGEHLAGRTVTRAAGSPVTNADVLDFPARAA